jgi:hypothetical protein
MSPSLNAPLDEVKLVVLSVPEADTTSLPVNSYSKRVGGNKENPSRPRKIIAFSVNFPSRLAPAPNSELKLFFVPAQSE